MTVRSYAILDLSECSLYFYTAFDSGTTASLFFTLTVTRMTSSELFPKAYGTRRVRRRSRVRERVPVVHGDFVASVPHLPDVVVRRSCRPARETEREPETFTVRATSPEATALKGISVTIDDFSELSSVTKDPVIDKVGGGSVSWGIVYFCLCFGGT